MSIFEKKAKVSTDHLAASVYTLYLEKAPELFDELDLHIFSSDPSMLINTLHALATASATVSAMRVARLARQLEMALESDHTLARTHLAREFVRLHMEFLAAKSEIEFLAQAMQG